MLLKTNTIIGHRGCSVVGQNNTIKAFLKAVEMGAEMVEMDIRKTRDGVLVVHHDLEIAGLRIRGYLYEDLVEKANMEGLVLPTLEHVLQSLEGKTMLDIELKEKGYEREVLQLILKYFTPNEFVITSFLDEAILAVKRQFPTVKCGLLLGVSSMDKELNWGGVRSIAQRISEFFPWRRVASCGADFIAPNWRNLLLGLLYSAHRRGIPVFVWTIDDPRYIELLLKTRRVSGLISNRPDLVAAARKSLSYNA